GVAVGRGVGGRGVWGVRGGGGGGARGREGDPPVGVGGNVVREHLDRDRAFEAGVAGLVDLPHAAASQEADDFEWTQPLAGAVAQGRSLLADYKLALRGPPV